jgi:hypothetical protein
MPAYCVFDFAHVIDPFKIHHYRRHIVPLVEHCEVVGL